MYSDQHKVVARVSTLKLIDKSDQTQSLSLDDPNAIPKASHWVDETEEDTVLVIEQPPHQICAAIGGIMASRMKVRGVRGCVVGGRVRDLAELKSSGLPVSDFQVSQLALSSSTTWPILAYAFSLTPSRLGLCISIRIDNTGSYVEAPLTNAYHKQIWASGRSTVGVGAEAKVYARNVTISIKDVSISPGDIVFCDPLEGVVVIPQALVDQVVDLIPKLVSADDKVKEDVEAGSTVQTGFKKHRG